MARPALYTKWLEGNVTANFASMTADAFGRLRVSHPHVLFESTSQYNTGSLLYNQVLTTGGTVTHLPNESAVSLNVTATTGSEVIRQSKRYIHYQPGRSLYVLKSFVLNTAKVGLRQRQGFFDANNGVFLQVNGLVVSFIRRTFTGGSADDATYKVDQANWNVDKLDGTGASGVTLDLTKVQLLFMDLQWLGVGRVRVGFVIGNEFIVAHEYYAANTLTTVYMTTATLPVREEITNTGSASTSAMKSFCSVALSEGGGPEPGIPFSATSYDPTTPATTSTAVNANTEVPLLAIRLKTTFNSITNRGSIEIYQAAAMNIGRAMALSLVVRPATTTGGTWTSVDADSIVEYNRGVTSYTSGGNTKRIVSSLEGAADAISPTIDPSLLKKVEIALDIPGTTSDVLLLTGARLEANNSVAFGILNWWENY
jgi:hypothetical protein